MPLEAMRIPLVEAVLESGFPAMLPGRSLPCEAVRRMVRRMPRLQVYLPEDLHREVKARGLPASELLQAAVRDEIRRRDLLAATERHLGELSAAVGEPTPEETERAQLVAARLARRPGLQA